MTNCWCYIQCVCCACVHACVCAVEGNSECTCVCVCVRVAEKILGENLGGVSQWICRQHSTVHILITYYVPCLVTLFLLLCVLLYQVCPECCNQCSGVLLTCTESAHPFSLTVQVHVQSVQSHLHHFVHNIILAVHDSCAYTPCSKALAPLYNILPNTASGVRVHVSEVHITFSFSLQYRMLLCVHCLLEHCTVCAQ